jgi:hypothetical protein
MADITSRQVSWWSVRDFVVPLLELCEPWPLLGTPAWCDLESGDERKWIALLDGSQHYALHLESKQIAICQASRDVAESAELVAVARRQMKRHSFYESRPWLKRVTA